MLPNDAQKLPYQELANKHLEGVLPHEEKFPPPKVHVKRSPLPDFEKIRYQAIVVTARTQAMRKLVRELAKSGDALTAGRNLISLAIGIDESTYENQSAFARKLKISRQAMSVRIDKLLTIYGEIRDPKIDKPSKQKNDC